jgi:S-formylglutathione hydrolase FrmB
MNETNTVSAAQRLIEATTQIDLSNRRPREAQRPHKHKLPTWRNDLAASLDYHAKALARDQA